MSRPLGTRIPFYRNPPIIPAGSIAMQSIGGGLLVFGAAALTGVLGTWSMVVVVGVLLATLTVITIHNRRLTFQRTTDGNGSRVWVTLGDPVSKW
ncbi:MAG: hypothetical protein H7247_05815 [Polaromonas sp.]|nr:hypothetical protein [Gemmatimonadaceae bacterium]